MAARGPVAGSTATVTVSMTSLRATAIATTPDDAVAMVRDDDGRTRIVAIGQTHRGWRLESLSGDAALFRRGTQQVRIALPASADDEPLEDQ